MTKLVRKCGLGPFEAVCATAVAALVAFTGFSPLANPIQPHRDPVRVEAKASAEHIESVASRAMAGQTTHRGHE